MAIFIVQNDITVNSLWTMYDVNNLPIFDSHFQCRCSNPLQVDNKYYEYILENVSYIM